MDNLFLPSYSMRPVVIANGRSLQSDAVINGYHVPKGVSFFRKTSDLLCWHSTAIFSFSDARYLPPFGCFKRSRIFPRAQAFSTGTLAKTVGSRCR